MKRKRTEFGHAYGNKDELLVKTTALNLQYNRSFGIEHNIQIYDYAKDKDSETIYLINSILQEAIRNENYISFENIKERCMSIQNDTHEST